MTPTHRQTGQSQTGRHKRKETLLRPPRYLSLRLHSRKRETATHFGPFKCLTDRLASSRRHVRRRFAFFIPRSLISPFPLSLTDEGPFPPPSRYISIPPLSFFIAAPPSPLPSFDYFSSVPVFHLALLVSPLKIRHEDSSLLPSSL